MDCTNEVLEELLNVEAELQDVQDQIKLLLDQQENLYARQTELKALLEDCEASGSYHNDATSTAPENWSGSFGWDS